VSRRRFFVPEIRRGVAELTGPDAEHLVRVLRAEPGQVYELSDNQNLYLAEIETARKSAVVFRILEELDPPASTVHLILLAALIKFDSFEWLVEKATELGVAAIQPFEAARTERGLAQAALKRLPRWEKIAVEASQQSRRARLPVLTPPVRFAKALETDANLRLQFDEISEVPPILQLLPKTRTAADRVALLLGPEGGWTDEERQLAMRAGWLPCSLGKTVLRAETAAVAALAIIQAAWQQ
jgi:16S rRNA (uracil1498-N3)-methyltransferase